MKLALNMGTLRGLGSSEVGRNIALAMLESFPEHDYYAWLPREWPEENRYQQFAKMSLVSRGLGSKLVADQVRTRRGLHGEGIDALFSLTDTATIRAPRPHMLLVQQAFLVAPPEHLDFGMPPAFKLKMWAMRRYFAACLPAIDRLTVQTRYMESCLIARWGVEASRISVIPSAVQPVVSSGGQRPPPTWKYLFYPSGPGPHKNHELIPYIIRELADQGIRLPFVVTLREKEAQAIAHSAQALGVSRQLVFVGRLSRAEVYDWMSRSAAVVNPSKLESFGLPYLEAIAVGAPQVVVDRPLQREICGPRASYAHGDSALQFAHAIAEIVHGEKSRGDRTSGEETCTWSDVAGQYMNELMALNP